MKTFYKLTMIFLALMAVSACQKKEVSTEVESSSSSNPKPESKFEIVITGDVFPEGAEMTISQNNGEDFFKSIKLVEKQVKGVDGFAFSGTLTDVGVLSINITKGGGGYPIVRDQFILEPGLLEVSYKNKWDKTVNGGPYNKLIVNAWNDRADYKAGKLALEEFLSANPNAMDDEEARPLLFALMANNDDIRYAALGNVANNHADPVARLLAYTFDFQKELGLTERLTIAKQLQLDTQGHPEANWLVLNAERAIATDVAKKSVGVGSVIKDFQAQDLAGNSFQLADVLAKNKYVMVEFWASWCGPCRGLIPHMKEDYEMFHSKGFEIVSFSLDDDRDDWQDASDEEQMPWINTGDLLDRDSPVVKMYGVQGLPKGFLIEAATGKIIAINPHHQEGGLNGALTKLLGE